MQNIFPFDVSDKTPFSRPDERTDSRQLYVSFWTLTHFSLHISGSLHALSYDHNLNWEKSTIWKKQNVEKWEREREREVSKVRWISFPIECRILKWSKYISLFSPTFFHFVSFFFLQFFPSPFFSHSLAYVSKHVRIK